MKPKSMSERVSDCRVFMLMEAILVATMGCVECGVGSGFGRVPGIRCLKYFFAVVLREYSFVPSWVC
jgi:hypothetical protein